jgi:hypothetical protein
LERVQTNEGRGAEDEQQEESQRRATQMFNKMIFDRSLSLPLLSDHIPSSDRLNEILAKLHQARHLSALRQPGTTPTSSSNTILSLSLPQRMVAENLPLERDPVLNFLKQKLEANSSSKKGPSLAEKIQVKALELIREEIQSGLLESAESITDMILSRLIVDTAHSALSLYCP